MKWLANTHPHDLSGRARCAAHIKSTAFFFALLLTSCSIPGTDIGDPERMSEREPRMAQQIAQEETVRGKDEPPIVTLQLSKRLRQSTLVPAEELPRGIKIGATNLNNVPVTVALEAVLADTDITLLWSSAELQNRTVTLMNLKGALPTVVNRVCRAAHILCFYRNGALELSEEDTFVVELPPVASASGGSAANTMADAIGALIKGTVKADEAGGNLIFTTDADGHERVQSYLDQLRNGRPLIVMQLHIWEVSLDDSRQLGINWSALKGPLMGGMGQSAVLNSVSSLASVPSGQGINIGAMFSGAIDANMLASFLSTQGKVQNISSPQLTFVSGTSAKFQIGGKQRFVSQVGTLLSSTVAGSTNPGAGVSNNTVSTEELSTGLNIETTGSYSNGVVFASMALKTTDLVRINTIPTGTTQLQLPETSDRTVQTVLRVRPGDSLVLAGLQTAREDRSRDGILAPDMLGGMIPLSGSNKLRNSELVILVKPAVVFFSDKDSPDLQSAEEIKPGIKEPAESISGLSVDNGKSKKVSLAAPQILDSKPSELQSEFNTVVKLFEETHDAPARSQTPPPDDAKSQEVSP